MKILLVQNTDYIKRNPAQQHHLSELISLRGHEVRVIDFELLWRTEGKKEFRSKRKIFSEISKIHKDAKVTVVRPGIIKVPIFDYLSFFYGIRKEIELQIKKFKPDLIISLGVVSYIAGKAAQKYDVPFLYYWIDVSHRLIPFKFLQPMGVLLERRALKISDKVLTINKRLNDYVIKLGANPEDTDVVSAGIYINKFDPSISDENIRNEYGIEKEDLVLLFMGWLYDFSGLKEVSKELAKIRNENPNLKILIVGDGDAFEYLKKLKEEHNLENLILTGKQPYEKIPEFISSADICILPAYPDEKIMQDIVPIKIYEYMAMSKPVIITELPGVMKEFGNDCGIIYIKQPEDVLKVIKNLNQSKIEEMGKKARCFVESNDWEIITNKFEKILYEVV